MKNRITEQKGFTLLEIAIVLVIIGLIIGGILKGQAILTDGKTKKMKSDIDAIVAAVLSYQDKYSYLPGDDPVDRFSLGANGDGDARLNEANDRVLAWRALIAAGFFAGDSSQTTENLVAKKTPFGGVYYFRYAGATGNYVYVTNVPVDPAETLDVKYDDGAYDSGMIQANGDYTGTAPRIMYWYVF